MKWVGRKLIKEITEEDEEVGGLNRPAYFGVSSIRIGYLVIYQQRTSARDPIANIRTQRGWLPLAPGVLHYHLSR